MRFWDLHAKSCSYNVGEIDPISRFLRENFITFFLFNLSFFRYLRRVQSQSCTSPLPLLILRSPFYFWPLAIQPCCTLWRELKGLISQLNKSTRYIQIVFLLFWISYALAESQIFILLCFISTLFFFSSRSRTENQQQIFACICSRQV